MREKYFCPNCRGVITCGERYCGTCGAPAEPPCAGWSLSPSPTQRKNRMTPPGLHGAKALLQARWPRLVQM